MGRVKGKSIIDKGSKIGYDKNEVKTGQYLAVRNELNKKENRVKQVNNKQSKAKVSEQVVYTSKLTEKISAPTKAETYFKYIVGYPTDKAIISESSDKPERHLTPFEKMEIVVTGISKKGFEQLKAKTALDYDRFAKMLSTTKVTLINKKGDEKFSASLSERIMSVADVYSYGYEVFEDEERFNRWMFSPILALGGKAPYEIMDNEFGREEVRNIIGRIAYGVYS